MMTANNGFRTRTAKLQILFILRILDRKESPRHFSRFSVGFVEATRFQTLIFKITALLKAPAAVVEAPLRFLVETVSCHGTGRRSDPVERRRKLEAGGKEVAVVELGAGTLRGAARVL